MGSEMCIRDSLFNRVGESLAVEECCCHKMQARSDLVPELSFTSEDHRYVKFVGSCYHVFVAHGAAWLDDHSGASRSCCFDTIGEWVEGVTRACSPCSSSFSLRCRDLTRFDTVLLPGPNSPSRKVLR